jgi:hypothetical protein
MGAFYTEENKDFHEWTVFREDYNGERDINVITFDYSEGYYFTRQLAQKEAEEYVKRANNGFIESDVKIHSDKIEFFTDYAEDSDKRNKIFKSLLNEYCILKSYNISLIKQIKDLNQKIDEIYERIDGIGMDISIKDYLRGE